MNLIPFSMPPANSVLSLSVTTTPGTATATGIAGNQILLMNATSQGCYIAMDDSLVEATINDIFIPGNTTRVFTVSASQTHLSAITATGTTTLLAIRGDGA